MRWLVASHKLRVATMALLVASVISRSVWASQPKVFVQGYVAYRSVIPVYPESALKKGLEGQVVIQFRVDQFGIARDLKLLRTSSISGFERSAMAAIKASRFKPIAMRVTQIITFSLAGEIKPAPKTSRIGKRILTAAHNNHYED